jgi:hypothetical protein
LRRKRGSKREERLEEKGETKKKAQVVAQQSASLLPWGGANWNKSLPLFSSPVGLFLELPGLCLQLKTLRREDQQDGS